MLSVPDVGPVDAHAECVGRGQRVLPEPERQPREFGGVLAVKLLVGVGKGRAAASETLIGVLEQFPVLFAKTSRMLVNLFHPGEQLGIERDVVRQFGQLGLHALCDLLHFVRRVGFEQVEEKPRDAIEQLALTLQRHDRIAKGGFLGVVHDRVDLGARAGDRGIERRFVVREFYLGGGVSWGVSHAASRGFDRSSSGSCALGIELSAQPAAIAETAIINSTFFIIISN